MNIRHVSKIGTSNIGETAKSLTSEEHAKLTTNHTKFDVTFLVGNEPRNARVWVETADYQALTDHQRSRCMGDFRAMLEKDQCTTDVDIKAHFLLAVTFPSPIDSTVDMGDSMIMMLSTDFELTEEVMEQYKREHQQSFFSKILQTFHQSGLKSITHFSSPAIDLALIALHRHTKQRVEELAYIGNLVDEEALQFALDAVGAFANGKRKSDDEIEDFFLQVLAAYEEQSKAESSSSTAE